MEADLKMAVAAWHDAQPSVISAHRDDCCRIARAWFLAADASYAPTDDVEAPIWLRRFKPWGPARWPSYWCDLESLETWDCGQYAAVAAILLERRGHEVMRVQLAQQATQSECRQWSSMWLTAGLPASWVGDGLVYHEVCAVRLYGHRVQVWDPTENLWLWPTRDCAQAQNRAVRFVGPGEVVHWEDVEINVGTWTLLRESTG
jgi:hypothetical protein